MNDAPSDDLDMADHEVDAATVVLAPTGAKASPNGSKPRCGDGCATTSPKSPACAPATPTPNAAMLTINDEMGFRPIHPMGTWQALNTLAATLPPTPPIL